MTSIFLLFFLLSYSCTDDEIPVREHQNNNNSPTVPENFTPVTNTENFSYLALGDSYTIGQSVAEELSWPYQLEQKLLEKKINISETNIIAQTGWTTTSLLNSIKAQDPKQHDLVSLLIGVNNQYQKLPFEKFRVEFDMLLDESIRLAGDKRRVFVVSIPDYGVTPFGSRDAERIWNEIKMYNTFAENRCIQREIPFIDVSSISREMASSKGALADDNLHPSGLQYQRWTEKILPSVIKLFEEKSP
jgi:lysophospholipase L1-like esterase